MANLILLTAGFAVLVLAADWLVDGASGISRRFGVPELVVGLTVLAFGTSAPELFVNGAASLGGQDALVLGNVLGSNVFNTLLVLGVGAVIAPLAARASETRRALRFGLLAALGLLALANDAWFFEGQTSQLTRGDGLILLAGFVLFLRHTLELRIEGGAPPQPGGSPLRDVGRLAAGLIGLPLGAHLVVVSATALAETWGLSQSLIGLTIVSVGTSLPELAATAAAAWRGRADLAVGNVLGSNLFNLLLVLGASSALSPITYDPALNADALVFVAASALVGLAVARRGRITRAAGAALIAGFVGYLAFLGVREAVGSPEAMVGGGAVAVVSAR